MAARLSILLPCHKCKVSYCELEDEEVSLLLPWEYMLVITLEQLISGCFPVYTASYDIYEIIWGSLSLIDDSGIITPWSVRKCCIRFEEMYPLLQLFFFFFLVAVGGRSLKSPYCIVPSLLMDVWVAGSTSSLGKYWKKSLCWNSCTFGTCGCFYEVSQDLAGNYSCGFRKWQRTKYQENICHRGFQWQIPDRLFPMLSEPSLLTVNKCLTLFHYTACFSLIYSFMTSGPFN